MIITCSSVRLVEEPSTDSESKGLNTAAACPKKEKWQVRSKTEFALFWVTMMLHMVKQPNNDPESKGYNQVAADSGRYKMVDKK